MISILDQSSREGSKRPYQGYLSQCRTYPMSTLRSRGKEREPVSPFAPWLKLQLEELDVKLHILPHQTPHGVTNTATSRNFLVVNLGLKVHNKDKHMAKRVSYLLLIVYLSASLFHLQVLCSSPRARHGNK